MAIGGISWADGTYKYHKFETDGLFEVLSDPIPVDILIVAGGGAGGGAYHGAGGGGGGVLSEVDYSTSVQEYTVTVGAGGVGASNAKGTSGGNSVFGALTAYGGGAGGRENDENGVNGGCGGGARAGTAGTGTEGQGYGGGVQTAPQGAGGGGGAAEAGGNGNATVGGSGGDGVANSITGSEVYYGGGGGGACYGGTGGAGGTGGGGAGGTDATGPTAGTAKVGGGGGGADRGAGLTGGSGGSGIVFVRYAFDDSESPTTIYSINPTGGVPAGGTEVTIHGVGFTDATAVKFGNDDATSFSVVSDRIITATAPAHVDGTVQVKVTSPSGTSADTEAANFTYVTPAGYTVSGVTMVPSYNGLYVEQVGLFNGKPYYKIDGVAAYLAYDGFGSWCIGGYIDLEGGMFMADYYYTSSADTPPTGQYSGFGEYATVSQ